MTVLRSREVKSLVEQNNSRNSKNTKQPRVSSIEPKTPSVTHETQAVNASNSSSQMTDGSRSGSVRRSVRLASKNCDSSRSCGDSGRKSDVVSSRKRKSVRGIEEERKLIGVELEDVVVEDSMGSDLGGVEGSGEVSEKGEGERKVGSEGGVELEDLVIEDSVGSGMEGGLGGDGGSGDVSKKGKGKRKLEGVSVGEGEGDGGCLRLRSGKKVAGGGGVRGFGDNVDVLMRDARGDDDGGKGGIGGDCGGEENGGQGGLKSSFDDGMEVGSGKVEALHEVNEGLRDEAVSVDDEDEGRVSIEEKGKGGLGFGIESVGKGEGGGGLRLRSGKKVAARGGVRGIVDDGDVLMRDAKGNYDWEKGGVEGDCGVEENGGQGGLKSSFDDEMEGGSGKVDEGLRAEAVSVDDVGKGRVSRNDKGKGKVVDMAVEPEANKVEVSNGDDVAVKKDGSLDWKSYVSGNNPIADRYRAIMAKINKGSNGEGVKVWDEIISKCIEGVKAKLAEADAGSFSHKGKGRARDETVGSYDMGRRRPTRQDKGKRKLAENLVESKAPRVKMSVSGNAAVQDGMPEAPRAERSNSDNVAMQNGTHVQENDVGHHATRTRDRFRAQARRSASRFAFFSTAEEEQNHVVDEAEADMAPREMDSEMEDWPGPFSTAMKIIKERGMNVNLQQNNSSSGKETPPMTWVPKQEKNHKRSNLSVPLLQELCMITLTKNADALTSLDYVPDVLRHKLSHMLCDKRKMNSHFLELLVRGAPTEIRVRDCSWLSEEDFTKIFAGADISNLAVLQLDQCGRCMPDYILYDTLGRSPNCLPSLTTLSLKGACRLSDNGLSSLLSSAPALRSLNLSQCSLLTFGGINSIADSLGSVLRELYLDDCESIDPILLLPALSKLEYLEVLSLAGLHTICDDFICQLIALRGHKLKELVLADCVKLTDISLKVISKSCSGICALDLTNLCKLTDFALGYLANGCQSIRSLKLRRNIFSDEAVAAYLETSGGSLEELSLNNVSKVADNTAISLSKCSKNLQNLDLSFCRKLSNEAVGLIADGCLSLKTLKLFGCTQITDVFLDGHSNEQVQVIGLQMTPILGHIKVPELVGPLRYSAVSSL